MLKYAESVDQGNYSSLKGETVELSLLAPVKSANVTNTLLERLLPQNEAGK